MVEKQLHHMISDTNRRPASMIKVICALILDGENRVLVAQRGPNMSMPLKWEFPGGKMELNESAEECIIREIKEELSINVHLRIADPGVKTTRRRKYYYAVTSPHRQSDGPYYVRLY